MKVGDNEYSLSTGDKCNNKRWKDTKYILKLKSNYYSYVFINICLFCYFWITDFLYIVIEYNNKLGKNLGNHKV